MVSDEDTRQIAHDLMLRALDILDNLQEQLAAIHLQQAIDTLTKAPIVTDET